MEYLPFDTTADPMAVEVIVCKPIDRLNKSYNDEDLKKLCTVFAADVKNEMKEELKDFIDKNFLPQVIKKRIAACVKYIMDDKGICLLSYVAQSPGNAVMLIYYLAYWGRVHNKKEINFYTMCMDIFPTGFPSQEDLTVIWDKQKVKTGGMHGSDNLVDYVGAAKSLTDI